MKAATTVEQLADLIEHHLDRKFGNTREKNQPWVLKVSEMSGRGVFATRDIAPGEYIFRERPLLVGPTARKENQMHTCVICYHNMPEDVICPKGCALPVCVDCCESEAHTNECNLYCKWKPKNTSKVNTHALRILSIVRCFFLNENEHKLLFSMQAHIDKYYLREIERAADCFENFPKETQVLEYIHRTIFVFNTNAFVASSYENDREILLRALFPLAGLINHECTPSASHWFEDAETMVVSATRHISKGEEITLSYTKLLWSNLARKVFLGLTKHFSCKCQRCLDPTENGTYLSALYCRAEGCKSITIPVQTKIMQPDWRCISCEQVVPHAKMSRYQDFALNTINNRINNCSISEMIRFINELCPRFCPSKNYVLIEAKLNVIWRMSRSKKPTEEFTKDELQHRDQYRQDILKVLDQLGAGECTLKKLINGEIQ